MSLLSVRADEPVARHSPWRTGGRCGVWVVAHDLAGLAEVVADCRAVRWRWTVLGAGTRTVFRDGPVPGAVLRLGTGFAGIEVDEVGAAVPVPALVAWAAATGRAGVERFACVAGSLGASLLHDDGWDDVVEAVGVLRRGDAVLVPLAEARRKRPVVLSARLRLREDDPAEVTGRTATVWAAQRPPCLSWYEAPRKKRLRTMLSAARLPLVRLRQVAIPELAPELLVNLGEGTAADLSLLHRSAVERVAKTLGEDLRSRIRWVGTADEEETWSSGPSASES